MAQDYVDLPAAAAASVNAARGCSSDRPREAHVVVATQNLPRMSGAIQMLIQAGYLVTAYGSATRLLPRIHRLGSPVALLVIDGGLAPAFARAAAIAARAAYAELPIILLASSQAARCTDFMPERVTVLPLPASEAELVSMAVELAPPDGPPDRHELSS